MSNFGLPEYDQHREWIRNARNRNMKWEEIDYAGRGNDEGLSEFLTQQSLLNFWKEVSCSEWKELVRLQKEAEEQTQVIDYLSGQAMIMGEGEDNDVTVPADPQSAWQLWVTVGDAFSDLPEVFPTADSKYKLVSLNIEYPYKTEAQNEYQKLMRTWYGKEGFGVSANAFRRNTRDFPIFERMQQGDNYIAATKIAEELFYEEAKLFGYEKDSEEYISLYNKMVPQYDKEKFENKWKKLDETKPSHTLVAHLGKDTYSHIHPIEPRGITVREAARLQSFPDDFFFDCSMGDAFKQIGNAVPPLLAYGVAKTVLNTFEEE